MNSENVKISQFDRAYFIGVGGIGMSSLARYFISQKWQVAGYDKTSTELTRSLVEIGVQVHYNDLGSEIPNFFLDKKTLVIYTPAIPQNMGELNYLKQSGLVVMKRSEVLGMITANRKVIAVSGTHGKTTTSALLAHILMESSWKCTAFLGGIATNYNSNFISDGQSELTVVEADEFDRSFLTLRPYAAIMTTTDADHLDIYGEGSEVVEGFHSFAKLIDDDGFLIKQHSVEINHKHSITYGIDVEANYTASNLRYESEKFLFDLMTPSAYWMEVELGIPGIHNAENAIACVAMAQQLKVSENDIRAALTSFRGVKRRFEYHVKTEKLIYIDDYAHHPTEISALLSSIKLLYPDKATIGIFQPHLFSRTRDFFNEFANALSRLDEVILLPIYPAREAPIDGINSEALLERITCPNKSVLTPEQCVERVAHLSEGVLLTIGAGDIDQIVRAIAEKLVLL